MSKFKVGDKVVCVTSWQNHEVGSTRHRIAGEEYIVANVRVGWGGAEQINVMGAPTDCWHEAVHYKLAPDTSKFHKHHDLIIAWAKGAKIERYDPRDGVRAKWSEISKPHWLDEIEYRIKPEPKPDVTLVCKLMAYSDQVRKHQDICNPDGWMSDVRATFDGETGKLKAVELLF